MSLAAGRLAVDIGGTFTDIVLETTNGHWTAKVLTTPEAPDEAVIEGIGLVMTQANATPADIDLIIHGTTLATNAILERKGAATAFITTEGFRDVLEIGYESRHDQYDLMIDKPAALVPRSRRLTVRERTGVAGDVLLPLAEGDVQSLIPQLQDLAVESIAIGLMHAYANPQHEARIAELLSRALPDMSFSLSSEVCPEVREYERFSTTVANAYVRPLMEHYLGRLQERLKTLKFACRCC